MTTAVFVSPNPFNSIIRVEITCAENENCIILLVESKDKRVRRILGVGLKKGTNHVPLDDLQSLQLGAYQLYIKDIEGGTIYKTVLVKE
ncbi:MAG: hypothetical protein J0H74_08530 [Chitinophagaceae bacterium]|nr:hypothetical protein [Chitinophagaceae bacterium]